MNDFIEQFERIVSIYPDNIAITQDSTISVTYKQLYNSALSIADELTSKGIKAGDLVGLRLNKSIDYIVALLGVWINGAAFIPFDNNVSEARFHYIVEQAKPAAIIFDRKVIKTQPSARVYPYNSAYAIFTSGSTGRPKGVLVSNKGIVNVLNQQIDFFQLSSTSRFFFYLSTGFDASISDIGVTLLSGANLFIYTQANNVLATYILKLIEQDKISHIDIPPSLLSVLNINNSPQNLKTIIIGGEVCDKNTILKWSLKHRLINVYGPTEATICTSMILCGKDWSEPSIGHPMENIEYLILNNNLNEAVVGELYISGVGIAEYYINYEQLSQQKFVWFNNKKYFRTNDLVRKKTDNEYIFIGRSDRQIKIRGQLVAPEEIESALLSLPVVKKAAVIAKSLNQGSLSLVAFVEIDQNNQLGTKIINEFLKQIIPSWMIPTKIIFIDKIPLLANEKVDFNLLHEVKIVDNNKPQKNLYVSKTTKKLQSIWQQTFKLNFLPSPDLDFFDDLGGDSLKALEMIIKAETEDIILPVGILGKFSTINDLSTCLDNLNQVDYSDALSAEILKADSAFEAAQIIINKEVSKRANSVLLIGATGFLGSFVLKQILSNMEGKVFCLVRAKDVEQAFERIKSSAKKYGIDFTEAEAGNIIPLIGDLVIPDFGLSDDYLKLSNEISSIYHCAGEVNMVKSYEQLQPANFRSVVELVKFANIGCNKKLNFASSLSVFVASNKTTGICFENSDFSEIKYLYGGYAQSKFASDYFLQLLKGRHFDINIFRFGLITGNSKTGICSSHDYLKMFVKELIDIGAVPDIDLSNIELDVTPVDYAAKAMFFLSNNNETNNYHIANISRFSLQMIVNSLIAKGYKLQNLPFDDWQKYLENIKASKPSISAAYMALCRLSGNSTKFENQRAMDLFQATDIKFDMSNSNKYLLPANIICPEANDELLENYLHRALNE